MDQGPLRILVKDGDRTPPRTIDLVRGAKLRDLLAQLGLHVEGCALWWEGEPVPSDFVPTGPGTLEIVHTFSGG